MHEVNANQPEAGKAGKLQATALVLETETTAYMWTHLVPYSVNGHRGLVAITDTGLLHKLVIQTNKAQLVETVSALDTQQSSFGAARGIIGAVVPSANGQVLKTTRMRYSPLFMLPFADVDCGHGHWRRACAPGQLCSVQHVHRMHPGWRPVLVGAYVFPSTMSLLKQASFVQQRVVRRAADMHAYV